MFNDEKNHEENQLLSDALGSSTPPINPFAPISATQRLNNYQKNVIRPHITTPQTFRSGQQYAYSPQNTEAWMRPSSALPPIQGQNMYASYTSNTTSDEYFSLPPTSHTTALPLNPLSALPPMQEQSLYAGYAPNATALPLNRSSALPPTQEQGLYAGYTPNTTNDDPFSLQPSPNTNTLPAYLQKRPPLLKNTPLSNTSNPSNPSKPPLTPDPTANQPLFTTLDAYRTSMKDEATKAEAPSTTQPIQPIQQPLTQSDTSFLQPLSPSISLPLKTPSNMPPAPAISPHASPPIRRRRTDRNAQVQPDTFSPLDLQEYKALTFPTSLPVFTPSEINEFFHTTTQPPVENSAAPPVEPSYPLAWQSTLTTGALYGNSFRGEGESAATYTEEFPFFTNEIDHFFNTKPSDSMPDTPPAQPHSTLNATQAAHSTAAVQATSTPTSSPSTQAVRKPAPTPCAQAGRPAAPSPSTQAVRKPAHTPCAQVTRSAKATNARPNVPPKPQPARPPIRPWRLISLISAAAMLLFCTIVGGKMVIDLSNNEKQMIAYRQDYLALWGEPLDSQAMGVELLPPGTTFQPTQTPAAVQTASPRPDTSDLTLIDTSLQAVASVTTAPSTRKTRTSYPNNPLSNIMPSMEELYAQYPDVKGQVVIQGVLDEKIAMRNNTYYLNHNYRGGASDSGAVFIDESCTIQSPPQNLLLRGQSSYPGKVFAPLWRFVEEGPSFVSTATTLSLTTLYEEEHFVLFAVILAGSTPGQADYFNFASHPSFATDESMLQYVKNAQAHSLYQFKVDVNANDRLLTLATLGNSKNNQSLVLLYRMLREGETPR